MSAVPSREPSSMTSVSMTSMPGTDRGRSAIVAGSVCASFRHGIWIISFFTKLTARDNSAAPAGSSNRQELFDDAVPGHAAGGVVPGVAEPRGQLSVAGEPVDGPAHRPRFRIADEPVGAIGDELVRPSRVRAGD